MNHRISLLALFLLVGGTQTGRVQDSERTGPPTIKSESEAVIKLDSLVGGASVWDRNADSVEAEFKSRGFAWLSAVAKNRAVIRPGHAILETNGTEDDPDARETSYEYMQQKLELFGHPAHEVTLEFSEGQLSRLTVSIWNKGDARQNLTEELFNEIVTKSQQGVDLALKARGRDMGKDSTTGIRTSRYRWETSETLAQLEYSSSRNPDRSFQAEFVRLRLLPRPRSLIGGNAALVNAGRVRAADLPKRLKRDENGDVFIPNLPMVDQGEKGYCAVAATERVLRYYGLRVDQHELAHSASTTAFGGTKPSEYEDALDSIQRKLKVDVRDLITFDERDFRKLVQNYNRQAKRMGGRNWAEDNYFFDANTDILREAKCANGAYEKFWQYVVEATERGLPLLWALHLGQYPETGMENPQGGGGHMRTIIGYNAKTEEVIFSDSWGAGHEFKKMKGRDACAATLGLFLINLD